MTNPIDGAHAITATRAWQDPFPDVPVACSCRPSSNAHPGLEDLLEVTQGESTKCAWRAASVPSSDASGLEIAACILADAAMRWRCRGAKPIYERWRDAVCSGSTLSTDERRSVAPFVKSVFGLPEAPPEPVHLRGWIAEFIWFRLAANLPSPSERQVRHIEGPSFHATEPGGDGLVVWSNADDEELRFSLWEIKHYAGSNAVSPTIKDAYDQLDTRALEYLAKFTSIEAIANDPELAPLSAEMVDLWADGDGRCGVGVAVATSDSNVPRKCFTTMGNYFPRLDREGQLEGLITGVGAFAEFCKDVRDRVWTAL